MRSLTTSYHNRNEGSGFWGGVALSTIVVAVLVALLSW